jgi:hypothetical protein
MGLPLLKKLFLSQEQKVHYRDHSCRLAVAVIKMNKIMWLKGRGIDMYFDSCLNYFRGNMRIIVLHELGRILMGRCMTYFDVLVQNFLRGNEYLASWPWIELISPEKLKISKSISNFIGYIFHLFLYLTTMWVAHATPHDRTSKEERIWEKNYLGNLLEELKETIEALFRVIGYITKIWTWDLPNTTNFY